jgi:hypothetical protein
MVRIQIILMLVLSGGLALAAMAPDPAQEKPPIPPDLYYDFKAVAPEDNAIIDWRRAVALEVPPGDRLTGVSKYAWTPEAREPSDEDLNALRSWLRRDKEALDLFNASLQKPKAQWPEQDPQNRQPELSALVHFTKARLVEADLLAKDKKLTNAVESLEGSLKLVQFGLDGDPASLQYILSTGVRTLTQRAMLRLAASSKIPEQLLGRLLKDLPRLDSETNTFTRVLRAGFTRYAYRTTDVRRLVESWSKISETNDALFIYPEELRRPFKVLLDPLLVAAHPKPLDEIAQINKDVLHYRIFRTNCLSAWTNRSQAVDEDRAETIEQLKQDIQPLMDLVKDEPLPLSKQAADRARNAYLRIKNPIGRIFAGEISSLADGDARVFRCRTEREAVRAMIALLIFERQKGMLPGKLSDLVDARILDSVPFDYFANAPMSYSRERRIVWSVGQDGEDDDGDSDGNFLDWYSGDAVWHVPKTN